MTLIILATVTGLLYALHLYIQDKKIKRNEEKRLKEFNEHWDKYFNAR